MKKEKKIKRIEQLIARLQSGNDVPRKDLKVVLTEKEMEQLDKNWESEKKIRTNKPPEIKEYEKKLGVFIRKYGFYETKWKRMGNRKATVLYNKCEKEGYNLIQRLEEIIGDEPDLCLWFDRDIDDDIGPSPSGMPRVVTSKSLYNQNKQKGPMPVTKRILKEQALKSALNKLCPFDSSDMKLDENGFPVIESSEPVKPEKTKKEEEDEIMKILGLDG